MTVTAVILAGRRSGIHDPLAVAADVPLKCLVPVAGKPLIDHVLSAVISSPSVSAIRIVVHDIDLMEGHLAQSFPSPDKPITLVPAAHDLVDSVKAGGKDGGFPC